MVLGMKEMSTSSSSSTSDKVLTLQTINPHVVQAEYAVRGLLAIRAEQLKEQLAKGASTLPFNEIIHCNIGNPQQLNQKPITFFRQVSALLQAPFLLDDAKRADVLKLFPADAIARAKVMSKAMGSMGSYSHSKGVPFIRQTVANFIQQRDGGVPSDPENIFLTAGASDGIKSVFSVLMANANCGVLIPLPQYPLYSATMTILNGKTVYYELDEANDWGLSADRIAQHVQRERANGVDVRAIVVINPGNPTGQCLSLANMQDIITLCKKEKIVLMADEVYQTNVYDKQNRPFHSFKKVLADMGKEYESVELFSFHSVSKGMVGECGQRGGYFEAQNIDSQVMDQLYKLASISLCPSLEGQAMVDLMVNPPKVGDESYEQYNQEVTNTYESLKRRANRFVEKIRTLEGVTCNLPQGAMYVFPQIRLSPKAIAAAKAANLAPDVFYSLALLEETGVCVVAGSGFGQLEGTFHYRATFLPSEDKFDVFLNKLEQFHKDFMNKYR